MSDSLGDYGAGVRWLAYRNGTAETVPAFALLRITGSDDDGTPVVAKPNADSMPFLLVNGPSEVIAGGNGVATYSEPVPVAYNDAATPAVGDTWGSANGSWLLTTGKIGWRVMSEPTGYETVEAVRDGNGGSGVVWSTTVAGILTTTTQTGAGAKIIHNGTDGSLASVRCVGSDAEDNPASPSPIFASDYTNTTYTRDGGLLIGHFTLDSTYTVAPFYDQVGVFIYADTGVSNDAPDGYGVSLSLVSAEAGTSVVVRAFVMAGYPVNGLGGQIASFAVWRTTGGMWQGIDRDFAAGDRPVVRGGLVVGWIDASGTHTSAGGRTVTPTTASLSLTTFLPTIITTEV